MVCSASPWILLPEFPAGEKVIFLTESSASDPDIISKLRDYVLLGGDAVITSGFLRKMQEELHRAGLTEAHVSDRKISVRRYQLTDDNAGYIDMSDAVIFPEILHGNNASWSIVNGGDGDYHTPLLLESLYGKGRLYTLSVPENQADICKLPVEVIDVLKRIFNSDDYSSGNGYSEFTYDDGSMVFYRYVKDDVRPAHVKICSTKDVNVLLDMATGEMIESRTETVREGWNDKTYNVADVILEPGKFKWFMWK